MQSKKPFIVGLTMKPIRRISRVPVYDRLVRHHRIRQFKRARRAQIIQNDTR